MIQWKGLPLSAGLIWNDECINNHNHQLLSSTFCRTRCRTCFDGNSARNCSKPALAGNLRTSRSISRSSVDVFRRISSTGNKKLEVPINRLAMAIRVQPPPIQRARFPFWINEFSQREKSNLLCCPSKKQKQHCEMALIFGQKCKFTQEYSQNHRLTPSCPKFYWEFGIASQLTQWHCKKVRDSWNMSVSQICPAWSCRSRQCFPRNKHSGRAQKSTEQCGPAWSGPWPMAVAVQNQMINAS